MSDPKRANLITVGAPISAKKTVNKTVRLTINLVESNESKYPELNYKELVTAEENNKKVENGKTGGLDPFSDNDEDVERVARKFEQKYGNNSTYGKKKRRSKDDDFADIGAGYDENDSFIDNTHGYDEMIPPECDTFLGGFYINCGSLEFKNVPHEHSETDEIRRNKRRISSSSSEDESSDSSSDSQSQDTKEPKAITNGAIDSHKTAHRKKKNKKAEKQKAKKVRRTDSSAATSGKQTSDDTIHPDGEGESVDSRTSHSDSLTSKPAPSSENAITSDSSRDIETKVDVKLPQEVCELLEALEASVAKHKSDSESGTAAAAAQLASSDTLIHRLEQTLSACGAESQTSRAARGRAARALGVSRAALMQRLKSHADAPPQPPTSSENSTQPSTNTATVTTAPLHRSTSSGNKNKRKMEEEEDLDTSNMSEDEREDRILETIRSLMDLIEEFKPAMFANYNMECERVREEKKKLSSDGAVVEKRLPKRRFPWCHRSRALLARLTRLARSETAAAGLLADRVLPLFPKGFVRMPTLMRQANLSKDVKIPETKRQRLGSSTAHIPLTLHTQNPPPVPIQTPPLFPEQIQFPSSLTVTATNKTSQDKSEDMNIQIMNTFSLSKDLIVEREKDVKEEKYIPPNNIGSITITPVPSQSQKDKKDRPIEKPPVVIKTTVSEKSLIRVKSPAALNESFNKKDVKPKKPEKIQPDKPQNKLETPLQVDITFQPTKKEPSPKTTISPKELQKLNSIRVKENNIPRPGLVPKHHSPTFAKPDKRPPEVKKTDKRTDVKKTKELDVKKKKDVLIVSDMDPLSDPGIGADEPLAIDDSSSDVEVIENDKSVSEVPSKDDKVPKSDEEVENINLVMKSLKEMEHSQEPTKFNSNSFGSIISNSNEPTSLSKTDGCNGVTG